MSQVVIVSNRLPISVKKEKSKLVYSPSIGGLATGLSSYINSPGNFWIGWPGIASDDLNSREKKSIVEELAKYNCYPVFLSKRQIDEFYNGYSNSILWPLFHTMSMAKVSPEKLARWWKSYQEVNILFAKATMAAVQKNSRVWLHDYHFLLLPKILRTKSPAENIGFFLHIPFPETATLGKFNKSKILLDGMLGADLVGFHTSGYVNNFLAYCKALNVGKIANKRIYLKSRTVQVGEFPMGIDYEKFATATASKVVKSAAKHFKQKHAGRKLIVSIDRLDPTKGLLERLRAYQQLLDRNHSYHQQVVFVMVAAPSRTDVAVYKKLSQKLDAYTAQINKKYGTKDWQPVDFINTAQPFEKVAALFQIADVAFIVPTRDGMNLTAKEFIASNKVQGVLILSETAGAAEELQDALIVDPEQPEALVEALEEALEMRKSEYKFKLARMKEQVSVNTVQHWAKTFVDSLQPSQLGLPNYPLPRSMNGRIFQNLYADFERANKRLLLLDYDGTLMPFKNNYEAAVPPKSLLKILEDLSNIPRTVLVLVSGRTAKNMDQWFGKLNADLVAEHGAAIKMSGQKTWHDVQKINTDWRKQIEPILYKYSKIVPGARVESKSSSLAWHYREAKPYQAQKYTVIIKKTLKPIVDKYGLEFMQGSKVLEIKNPKINKGNAIRQWLDRDYQFVLAIGDDTTDETMFRALPLHSYSIKVGRGLTSAKLRLASSEQVMKLLTELADNSVN